MIRLYEEGASDVEVCRHIRVSYDEFNARTKTDEIFAKLVNYGRLAAKSWWLEVGRVGAIGGNKINYSVWYAVMKNRYGWSDRVENVSAEGNKPIDQMSQDEIVAELAARKDSLAKLLKPQNVLASAMAVNESQ
jgi:hypothetical protein